MITVVSLGVPNGRDLEHRLRLVGILQLTEGDELSRVRRLALTHADNSPHRLGAVLERTPWNTPAKRRTKSQNLAQEALEIEAEQARAAG